MAVAEIIPLVTEKDIDDRRYHRVSGIARMYAISDSEIYRAIYAGELPALRYKSRVWLLTLADVDVWIEANTQSNVA